MVVLFFHSDLFLVAHGTSWGWLASEVISPHVAWPNVTKILYTRNLITWYPNLRMLVTKQTSKFSMFFYVYLYMYVECVVQSSNTPLLLSMDGPNPVVAQRHVPDVQALLWILNAPKQNLSGLPSVLPTHLLTYVTLVLTGWDLVLSLRWRELTPLPQGGLNRKGNIQDYWEVAIARHRSFPGRFF